MSAAAASFTASKPNLIKQLGSEYWLQFTLESVEHHLRSRSTKERVYWAIARCSYAHTLSSPHAIRPRLKKEGFEGWVRQLRERLGEGRAIRKGELNDEIADVDESGRPIALTQSDLVTICNMGKSHVSEAIAALRAEGSIEEEGELLAIKAIPQPAPKEPNVEDDHDLPRRNAVEAVRKLSSTLGIRLKLQGNSPDDFIRAAQFANAILQGYKTERNELRAKHVGLAKSGAQGNCILIGEEEDQDLHACMPAGDDANEPEAFEPIAAAKPKTPPQEEPQPEEPEPEAPPEPPERTPAALQELRQFFPFTPIRDEALETVHNYLTRELGHLYQPDDYVGFVRIRAKAGKIRTGVVLDPLFLPKDYCAAVRGRQKQLRPQEERDATPAREPSLEERIALNEQFLELMPKHEQAPVWRRELEEWKRQLAQRDQAKARGAGT